MGRLYIHYFNEDNTEIMCCNNCKIHLIEKQFINPIIGLEISMIHKLPINVQIVPNDSLIAYNSNNYKFHDILCNRCNNEIGWKIEYPTNYGYKELIFIQNESLTITA